MRARMAQYDLDELLVQVRRIEEHREKGAEKKIRDAYREILEELRHYLADVYSRYAEDDRLNYEILQKHSYYARFLEEVEQKINELSPEAKRLIRSTVEQAYEYTYNGMIDCVKRSNIVPDIAEGLKGCTDWILKRAVENPISKLTLNDRLEKHRKEIIYDIKQDISVGLLNGDRYSTMAKRVKSSVEGDYKKAIRITRTETHRVREAGNLDAATSVQEAADKGNVPVKMMKVWKTMRDERVRPAKSKGKNRKYDHRKMEGVSVPIDEEFTLPSGAKTTAPGQSGVAGEDINCRCYLSYELRSAEEAKVLGGVSKNHIEKRSDSDKMKMNLQMFVYIPKEKLIGYALNPEHPVGKEKARVFKAALGYTLENYEELQAKILESFREDKMVLKKEGAYGKQYEQIMKITGPNGNTANVLTAWIKETESSEPRLTSLYVTEKECK